MICILRSWNAGGHPVISALLECDRCEALGPDPPALLDGPDAIEAARVRLRCAGRRAGWASRTVVRLAWARWGLVSARIDLCPDCRRRRRSGPRPWRPRRPWQLN